MVVDNYIEVNLGKGVSDARKTLTEEIVRWCIRQLLPKVRTLDITVDLLDELDGGADGYQWSGEDNRQHFIEINENQYYDDFVTAVMHEMVHVKQYSKGELIDMSRSGQTKWQNVPVNKQTNYWDQPWEIEAHGKELGLFIRWAEDSELSSQSWTQEELK